MYCDVVYALNASGETPRIIDAASVQTRIEALATSTATRKARRDRAVKETGPLVCSKGCKMVFRQRGVCGRKPHFAHHVARSSGKESGKASTTCSCGGRGGNGHTHIMAQKLIAENIANIEFKHWCSKGLHQLVVRKDPGYTATIEQSARNANNERVRLDVSVHKNGAFAFAVEVTHTHRVSPSSRAGIPYVDVNAAETVRRLQRGERTLLCETASNVPACRWCEYHRRCRGTRHLLNWLRKANALWTLHLRRAFHKLFQEIREEKAREWDERQAMHRESCLAWDVRWNRRKKYLLRCREMLLKRAQEATRKAFDCLKAERRRKIQEEQREKDRQCKIEREKRKQRSSWSAFMSHSGRAQTRGSSSTSPSKRRRVGDGAKICFACKNSRAINKHQCSHCFTKYMRQGWGTEIKFSRKDDDQICELLNAYGEPMYKGYAPSRIFFYKSVLSFHDAFQHKKWEALVDYIRNEFECSHLLGARKKRNTKSTQNALQFDF